MFHHQRDSIEAHLNVVSRAVVVARRLNHAAVTSNMKLVKTLKPLRIVTIDVTGR